MVEEIRLRAARIAGHADLKDIQTFKIEAELHKQPNPDLGLGYDLDQDVKYGEPEPGSLVTEGSYELTVWQQDDEHARVEVARVSLVLGAMYSLPEDHPEFSEGELTAFAETTGQFALYPFLRQQIYDLTGRIGLPPLVLGLFRMQLDGDEVAGADVPASSDG